MKFILNILAIGLFVPGTIWVLQGINLLPGSFMTGHMQWALYGGMLMACSIVLIVLAKKLPHHKK